MKEEIKKELEQISPELSQTGNRNPFKVPSGYWGQLEKGVFNSIDISGADDAPPADYFDTLADRVISNSKLKKKAKIRSINYRRWIAAASVLIMVFSGYLLINDSNELISTSEEYAMDIDIDDAFDYLVDDEGLYLSDVLNIMDEDILSDLDSDEYDIEDSLEDVWEDFDDEQLEELF